MNFIKAIVRFLAKITIVLALVVLGWWFLTSVMGAYIPIRPGVKAEAKVIKVWDTGNLVNESPVLGLILEVYPPGDKPPFEVETRTSISALYIQKMQPGAQLRIEYDPKRPSHMKILAIASSP